MDCFTLCPPTPTAELPANNWVAEGSGGGGGGQVDPKLVPLEVSLSATGGSNNNEEIWSYSVTQPFSLPANFLNSQAMVLPDTFAGSFSIRKDGVEFGTITFTSGADAFVGGPMSFAVDDVLSVVSLGTYDFANLSISFRGTRL